jgi:predicted metal-dependent hydrolase
MTAIGFYWQSIGVAMKSSKDNEKFEMGIAHFNAGRFFEAHEAWEEIWLGETEPEKTFLQGIIQIAAAFHHYSRGNHRGMKSLLAAGITKLERFPDSHRGIALEALRAAAKQWTAALREGNSLGAHALPRIRALEAERPPKWKTS